MKHEKLVGFIGCGTLVAAVVQGLASRPGGPPSVLLSPRSQATSMELKRRYAFVSRADSNEEVVRRSDVVVLAVRPQQLDEALDGLRFEPDQVVLSFVAKLPLEELRTRVAPARHVARATPLPAIAHGLGPIVLYPPLPEAQALFSGLGHVVAADTEEEAMALGCVGGLMSTVVQAQATMADWLRGKGVPSDRATLCTRAMLEGVASQLLRSLRASDAALVDSHETAGGLNARARQYLSNRQWFEHLGQALDHIHGTTALRRPDGAADEGA